MDIEEFRKNGKEMVDFMCDYYEKIGKYPVKSEVKPGYLKSIIAPSAPINPQKFDTIMKDIDKKIIPGISHWQSPNFFAYFPSNSSYPGILGEMMSAMFNVVGFSWICSPACTELEIIMLDWVAKMIMLPEFYLSNKKGGGVIQGTASEASLVSLLAARSKAVKKMNKKNVKLDIDQYSEMSKKFTVYVSDMTHSSVEKACMIAGLKYNLRIIKSNDKYEMDVNELEKTVENDMKDGKTPIYVCATLGTTSATSNDDVYKIGMICKKYDIWLHVDAAYGGSFFICEEFRQFMKGIELTNSFNFNPHKVLLTNFDCSLLWVKERIHLINALSITPEYLRSKEYEKKQVFDYRDWQIPLGRRFRSLKLWFVIRTYGVKGLQEFIREKVSYCHDFEKWVKESDIFEMLGENNYSMVCFRMKNQSNEINKKLEENINNTGKLFLVHTTLKGKYVLRFSVGARLTKQSHVKNAFKIIDEEARKLIL